jgi:N-acetylmuramoyl-L-alanine amidase CwlA
MIKKEYAWDCLYSSRNGTAITHIVIHFTGDKGASAKNEADFFSKNPDSKKAYASAHYFADPKNVYKSVREQDKAWHCGLGSQNTFDTPHHPLFGKCSNSNSIGIEMCINDHGHVEYGTAKKVRALVKTLMKRYDIPASHVVRHYDVTGKECPGCKFIKSNGKLSQNTLLNDGTWDHFRDFITGKGDI